MTIAHPLRLNVPLNTTFIRRGALAKPDVLPDGQRRRANLGRLPAPSDALL